MKIKYSVISGFKIAEVLSDQILIKETQDALDLVAEFYYEDTGKIILHEKNILPDFFDLKNGIAGEILQKFSNYRIQLAIIGDFNKYNSKSLKSFISESNKYGNIYFVSSIEEARDKLIG